MVRDASEGTGDWASEDGQHGTVHIPRDAPRTGTKLAKPCHLRGAAVLQQQQLPQGTRLVSARHQASKDVIRTSRCTTYLFQIFKPCDLGATAL